jgi:hypothetical protein
MISQDPRMAENKTKRRPGIPHEALAYIVERAGGTIENSFDSRDPWVSVTIGGKTFTAENNTLLLIDLLGALK